MADTVLLDTHALIWHIALPDRMSPAAHEAVITAREVLASPISFWEVAMLAAKGRIELDRSAASWASDVLASGRILEAGLASVTAAGAGALDGFHGDPADRLIVATAIDRRASLVTRDQQIADWCRRDGRIDCVW